MERNLVVGIGEALWDMLPGGKKLGGAPANFAYHVSAMGLSSCPDIGMPPHFFMLYPA